MINIKDDIDQWVYDNALILINKSNYWYNIFRKYKVKLHYDPVHGEKDSFIKQIALMACKGCSFGVQRSYPMNNEAFFSKCYAKDLYFCWGEHSFQSLKRSHNFIKKIKKIGVVNYIYENNHIEDKLENFLSVNNDKFKILILDTNHDFNNDDIIKNQNYYPQVVNTEDMINFYKNIFSLSKLNNEKVCFLIKQKK